MMEVGRIQKFEGKITSQGKLLLRGVLLCTENTNIQDRSSSGSHKLKEYNVFLFDQSVIFSEEIGKRKQFQNPLYDYKNHLQVNLIKIFIFKKF